MPAIEHFLLVHGAWHGGWCWEKVTPLLKAAGYGVTAPTLAGLGERSGLLSPGINLSTHVRDIVEAIEKSGHGRTALVGHSYAGMVISSAAAVLPDRIGRLIYLDALVPLGEQSVIDLAPGFSRSVLTIGTPSGPTEVIPAPPPSAFGITDPGDLARAGALLTPMPYRALTERARRPVPEAARIPVSCIICARQFSPLSRSAHLAAYRRFRAGGQDCRKIDAPHDMMITDPRRLAGVLVDCASGSS